MSKSKSTDQPVVSWQQAPDGTWHPITATGVTTGTTVNVSNNGGCLRALGALVVICVLLVAGVFVIGALSTSGKPKTTPTTTSTSVVG